MLKVGGVKEKVLAATRAGFSRVILPAGNEKDMMDIPLSVKVEQLHLSQMYKTRITVTLFSSLCFR